MQSVKVIEEGLTDGGQFKEIGFYFGDLASAAESVRELTFPFPVHVIDFKLATQGAGLEQYLHVGKSTVKQKIEKIILAGHPVGKLQDSVIRLRSEYLPEKQFIVASFEAVEVTQQKVGGSFGLAFPRGVEFYDCFNVNDDLFQTYSGWTQTTNGVNAACDITSTTYGTDFYTGRGALQCYTETGVTDDAYCVHSLYNNITLQAGKVYRMGVYVYVSDWATKTAHEDYIFGLKDASGVTIVGIQLDADGTYLRAQGVYPTGASTSGDLLATGTAGEYIVDLDKWHYLELVLDLRKSGEYTAKLYLENLTDGGTKTLQATGTDLSLSGAVEMTETVKCGILNVAVAEARGWYVDSMSFWYDRE